MGRRWRVIIALACTLAALHAPGESVQAAPPRVVYLTFDDGPAAPYTAELLDILKEADAQVTFFQMGREAAAHPWILRRAAREGHALGNHSWSHPDLTTLERSEIDAELRRTRAAQLGLAGPCFRPPYGRVNADVREVADALGLRLVLWDEDVGDWVERPVTELVADLRAATRPGVVILMHDGIGPRENNIAAVAQMIPWWKRQGYRLKALPACLQGAED